MINFIYEVHGYNHHLSAKLSVLIYKLFFIFLIGPINLNASL